MGNLHGFENLPIDRPGEVARLRHRVAELETENRELRDVLIDRDCCRQLRERLSLLALELNELRSALGTKLGDLLKAVSS